MSVNLKPMGSNAQLAGQLSVASLGGREWGGDGDTIQRG